MKKLLFFIFFLTAMIAASLAILASWAPESPVVFRANSGIFILLSKGLLLV